MKKFTIGLILLIIFNTGLSLGQTFEIDPGHTAVTIEVKRFSVVDVVGRFNKVEGKINLGENPTDISTEITIDVNSYDSNNEGGEQAVKSPAFLDAANYQTIKFISKRIEKKGGQYLATGDLTIHGVTNEVSFPFDFTGPFKDPTGLNTVGVKASLTINRQDYGIKFSRKLSNGQEFIGNEVKIELNVLAAAA
ncbi:MAG: YceI family protein [Bacteroidota bacterium]